MQLVKYTSLDAHYKLNIENRIQFQIYKQKCDVSSLVEDPYIFILIK